MKTITGVSLIPTASGVRVSYSVTTLDEIGNIIKDNEIKTFIAVDKTLKGDITKIFKFIEEREA